MTTFLEPAAMAWNVYFHHFREERLKFFTWLWTRDE